MKKSKQEITREKAIKKIGNYGKYAALTAIGTFLILEPLKAQTSSTIDDAGANFEY